MSLDDTERKQAETELQDNLDLIVLNERVQKDLNEQLVTLQKKIHDSQGYCDALRAENKSILARLDS